MTVLRKLGTLGNWLYELHLHIPCVKIGQTSSLPPPFFLFPSKTVFQSVLLTNTLNGIVMAFKPIMLLWLVIMRLQGLIPVIVSLRSSESERRWCGFTPRGGKHRRGQQPLTDSRSKAPQVRGARRARNDQWGQSLTRPSNHDSQSRRVMGGLWKRCCVHPTWDYGAIAQKKKEK